MPLYNAPVNGYYQGAAGAAPAVIVTSLPPSDLPVRVWNAETVVAGAGSASGSASLQVALPNVPGATRGFSVSGKFSADPGTVEIDVQVSDVDSDAQYQTCANGNIVSVDSVNFTFHFDASSVIANFVRLLMRTRTNNVSVTADINR